jgi:hypothetical protein
MGFNATGEGIKLDNPALLVLNTPPKKYFSKIRILNKFLRIFALILPHPNEGGGG